MWEAELSLSAGLITGFFVSRFVRRWWRWRRRRRLQQELFLQQNLEHIYRVPRSVATMLLELDTSDDAMVIAIVEKLRRMGHLPRRETT
jgi:hypothetical protein